MTKNMTTQAEYARERGVSPQYISKLVRTGILKLQDGKIDPAQADKAIEAYAAGLKDSPGPKAVGQPDDDSLAAWRKKELQVKTAIRQLQLDEEKGKLINAEELKAELARLFTDVKTLLRQIPSKSAGEIYHLAKTAKSDREGMSGIATLLLAEIDEVLTQLSRWQPTSTKKGGGKTKKHGR